MSEISWNDGQVTTLKQGDTLTCEALKPYQLYAIFLYNSEGHDQTTEVTVNIGNAYPPKSVNVPGTTLDEGMAALALVSGSDTQTVSISNAQGGGGNITAWIGSVSMPINTSGMTNQELPFNGDHQPFGKLMRYFNVPETRWYQLSINSAVTQYISTQFSENYLTVFINNPTLHADAYIVSTGSVTQGNKPGEGSYYIQKPESGQPQTIAYKDQGNGQQKVWMSADSSQNSSDATITAQYL